MKTCVWSLCLYPFVTFNKAFTSLSQMENHSCPTSTLWGVTETSRERAGQSQSPTDGSCVFLWVASWIPRGWQRAAITY